MVSAASTKAYDEDGYPVVASGAQQQNDQSEEEDEEAPKKYKQAAGTGQADERASSDLVPDPCSRRRRLAVMNARSQQKAKAKPKAKSVKTTSAAKGATNTAKGAKDMRKTDPAGQHEKLERPRLSKTKEL